MFYVATSWKNSKLKLNEKYVGKRALVISAEIILGSHWQPPRQISFGFGFRLGAPLLSIVKDCCVAALTPVASPLSQDCLATATDFKKLKRQPMHFELLLFILVLFLH